MFSLKKLYKTLTDALPSAQVKILKMPQSASTKQSINAHTIHSYKQFDKRSALELSKYLDLFKCKGDRLKS